MVDRDRRWTAQIREISDDDNPYTTLIQWCREIPRTCSQCGPTTSSLIFSVFLDQHGLPRHVLTRDYLVTVVTALANRMVEDADFLTLAKSVRPPCPVDWPGPLGLPGWDALEAKHPPFATDVDLHT